MDRAVDVALGREIDDGARAVQRQERIDLRAVADVAMDEHVPGVATKRGKAAQIAGVGELVEVDEALAGSLQPVEHEVGADESGAAGDENHGIKGRMGGAPPIVRRCRPGEILPSAADQAAAVP